LTRGKYHRIPERPEDLKLLWNDARVLDNGNRPSWLTLEESGAYRFLGTVSNADLPPEEHAGYFAELEELESAGIIVDPNPYDGRAHHLFLAAPSREPIWSIGIFRGTSPLEITDAADVRNPVLTAASVMDVTASFVADPFMLRGPDGWHMFFEVMNWRSNKGEIGWASSADGVNWTYGQIVLSEPFHLSYPYVFQWGGTYFMVPESYQANSIRLYEAVSFPTQWRFVKSLIEGPYLADTTLFCHRGKWWFFTDTSAEMKNDTLRLFFADALMGTWREHPQSPVLQGNSRDARPGGRVTLIDGRLFRFGQSSEPFYGTDVRAFEIVELSPTTYREIAWPANPVLRPGGKGWNACGMHHLDAHALENGQWLASVDGWCWG